MKKIVGLVILVLIIWGIGRTLSKTQQPAPEAPSVVVPTKNEDKPVTKTTTLSDKEIAEVIKGQISELNKCYGKYVRKNPDARGRIQTTLTINPNGGVGQARVLSSPDKDLEKCIVQILKSLHFKEFTGEAININYPMNFN